MSTVTKTEAKKDGKKDASNLPKAPKKPGKPWVAKRADNAMRALRAIKNLHDRFQGAASVEQRTDFQEKVKTINSQVKTALATMETAAKTLAELNKSGYKPTTEKVKLAAGVTVWIKGGTWRKKYAGLYKPEEMDGLTVTAVTTDGRFVRVKSASGLQFGDASSSFKTSPVDYAKATEEEAAA